MDGFIMQSKVSARAEHDKTVISPRIRMVSDKGFKEYPAVVMAFSVTWPRPIEPRVYPVEHGLDRVTRSEPRCCLAILWRLAAFA
jgi:hypothetical protein